MNKLPLHGGDLVQASREYKIPMDKWLDLSTGINPEPYPVGNLPCSSFFQLPYIKPEFIDAVENYYNQVDFLAVAGTQVGIQALPKILNHDRVLLPDIGYQEHALHWQKSGAIMTFYNSRSEETIISSINSHIEKCRAQHIVIINPNNPTAAYVSKQQIIEWTEKLEPNYYVIVDEAFVDAEPEKSLLTDSFLSHGLMFENRLFENRLFENRLFENRLFENGMFENGMFENALPKNVIVLRSFGKFFGLAGVRLGFVFANKKVLTLLREEVGLWQVNGPAQGLAIQALNDNTWQHNARKKIVYGNKLTQDIFSPLLNTHRVVESFHHALFSSYVMDLECASRVSQFLAEHAILTRMIPMEGDQAILRVGNVSDQSLLSFPNLKKIVNDCIEHLKIKNNE